jgi:hypothetical protein
VTSSLLNHWHTTSVPSLLDLNHYLKRSFSREEKVPVSDDFYQKLVPTLDALDRVNWCSRATLEELFYVDDNRSASELLHIFTVAIKSRPSSSDGTEASFIGFWDNNIGNILINLLPDCNRIRDSNHHTNTNLQRPDFGLLLDLICLFRGEEKPPVYTGMHPRDELFDKLLWKYDPAPYILGLYFKYNSYCYSANNWLFTAAYFAIGPRVTYVAVTRERVIELESFNLFAKSERVRNVMYLIRLASVLSVLKKVVPTDGRAEFVTYQRCAIHYNNGKN